VGLLNHFTCSILGLARLAGSEGVKHWLGMGISFGIHLARGIDGSFDLKEDR
jgi:hypothetical protein